MTPIPEVQARLRQYLLGQLDDDRREEIERDLMLRGEVFHELLMLEDEMIDEYLSGKLNDAERARFEQHFLATSERHEKLKFGRTFNRYLSQSSARTTAGHVRNAATWAGWVRPFFLSPVRVAVLAIIVVGVLFGVWRLFSRQSEVDKGLLALNSAYREQRPIEARISSLSYAPFSQTRGEAARVDILARNRAEAILSNAVNEERSAAAHHAMGEAYLAKKQFDDAIKEFDEALKADPKNAQLYSDLGAAWLEKSRLDIEAANREPSHSSTGKGMEELGRSLDNFNKALDLDPHLLPALFNRALCRQQLTLFAQSEDDWRKYLEFDSTSPWADEARMNLAHLQQRKVGIQKTKQGVLEDFLNAQRRLNDEDAWQILSRTRDDLTGWAVARQLFSEFLTDANNGKQNDTNPSDKALAYLGNLERERSDEHYNLDLLRRYRRLSPVRRHQVVRAHELMEKGYEYYRDSRLVQAVDSFKAAQQFFEAADDLEESCLTQYWVGYCLAESGDTQKALSMFVPLQSHLAQRHYRWLLMRTLISIASAKFALNEYSAAIEYCNRSFDLAENFDRIGAFNALDALIEFYRSLNNSPQSLSCLLRGLPLVDCCQFNPFKLWRHYAIVASALNAAGLYAAALEFQQVALQQALGIGDTSTISISYAILGSIYGKAGEFGNGINYAQLAYDRGATRSDERVGKESMAYACLQLGDLYREVGKPDKAVENYKQAIALYQNMEFPVFLYQAHKGLLQSYVARSKAPLVADEIETTLALTEQYRSTILESDNRNNFFAGEQSVYDLATDFAYTKQGDPQQALNYAEMSRARSLLDAMNAQPGLVNQSESPQLKFEAAFHSLSVAQIQQKLPARTQLVEYAVLSNKVLIAVVSYGRPLIMKASSIEQSDLEAKIRKYLDYISRPPQPGNSAELLSKELYAILFTPVEPFLKRENQIIVIPDKTLNLLSFAALMSPSSNRYLIEDYCLSYAPSATVFLWATRKAAEKNNRQYEDLLSIGNPTFDHEEFPFLEDLPAATREAKQIAGSYHHAVSLTGNAAVKELIQKEIVNADVLHFATHEINQDASGLRAQLVLAKSEQPGFDHKENLAAYEIYRLELPRARLVVLSACRSGMDRTYAGEGAVSLARPFLVSGVPIVVASLWPVDSEASAQLMIDFHKQRINGHVSSAQALRETQLAMLRSSAGFQAPYFWAPFFLTGGYTSF